MNRFRSIFRKSIAGRLIAFSVIFALATITIASVVLWLILIGVVRHQIDQRLDVQIEGIREALSISPDGRFDLSGGFDNPPFDRPGSGWYWQVEGKDTRITSRSLQGRTLEHPPRPLDWRNLLTAAPRAMEGSDATGANLHFRFVRAVVQSVPVEITATAPASALRSPAIAALLWLVPVMMVLALFLIAGVLLQVRYGLAPVRSLRREIAAVSSGKTAAVSEYEVEELRPVAVEINRLVEQSRKRLADTRLHFANLAHGLKTPVASLAVALDDRNDPDGALRNLTERIDRRIRHHLSRTRGMLSDAGHSSSTPVRPHVKDILYMMKRIYAEKAVEARHDIETDEEVNCSSDDLHEILGAVLDNAFKWADLSVKIHLNRLDDLVVIVVEDDGPGINDNRIFEATLPGVRLDESVAGDGFGLSIAKELSELYGGRLDLSRASQGGLSVSVMLPRARPSNA